jgi:cell volume regulation protein A
LKVRPSNLYRRATVLLRRPVRQPTARRERLDTATVRWESVSEGEQILIAGLLLAAGLTSSIVAGKLRIPSLVLFLGVGMLAGSDAAGLQFDDYHVAREVGIVALALILFEGGLAAGWREVSPVLRPALSLALVGTFVTAGIAGTAAAWLFDLPVEQGMLLGAIVASTDGAAIFALLRDSPLKRRVARTLEAEAGFNDPVAVLLVLGFIDVITKPGYGALDMLGLFVQQLGIGGAVGIGAGLIAARLAREARLESPGLYPVASLATAAIAFGAADTLHGSGFLAVYLVGLSLGDAAIPARRTVVAFHDGLAWVAQLSMFLVLGLLVFPSDLADVALEGTVLALVIVFVARPVAALAATPGMGFDLGQRVVLGWSGLRGAVPVVLATFPVIAEVPGSKQFFDIVFFAVLVSTVIQGATIEPLARRLGAITSHPDAPPRRIRPQVHGFAPIFTVRTWRAEDGDPASPGAIDGRRVVRIERVRLDQRGALCVLEDGTFAVTGPLVARGGRRLLSDWVRRRLTAGVTETERRWWEDVLGALAL